MSATVDQTAGKARSQVWVAQAFLLSLLIPFFLPVGSLLLMPHRILLLVVFVPFFSMLFVQRRAGPVLAPDWLFFGAALWSGLALAANHPITSVIEPFGIHVVEFFGAYLLARVSIRSSADFRRMARTFFLILLVLVPFAVVESVTQRPVLLNLLPGSTIAPVDAGMRLGLRRAQTVFAHPILFGVFVSTGFGVFWYALRPRWMRFFAAPMVVVGTFMSLSAGALLSLVSQSLFIGWELVLRTLRKRWTIFALLAVFGYIMIDVLSNRTPFHVLVTYGTFYQGSAYARINIWNHGIENVWANPIFGLGLRDWARPVWMGDSVDNFWLLNTMRYGLPTILMIFAALFTILRRVALVEHTDLGDRHAQAAYLTVFGGLFIAGCTVHYWHAMLAFVMFIYGSGLWSISGGAVSEDDEDSGGTDPPPETRRLSRYTRQLASGGPIAGPRTRGSVARSAQAASRSAR